MIFIGYSSKDRYTIVESMVFHLKNYGFNVWYDFHDMYLSDARFETNFEHGIKDSKYVIFILSSNFLQVNVQSKNWITLKRCMNKEQLNYFQYYIC